MGRGAVSRGGRGGLRGGERDSIGECGLDAFFMSRMGVTGKHTSTQGRGKPPPLTLNRGEGPPSQKKLKKRELEAFDGGV